MNAILSFVILFLLRFVLPFSLILVIGEKVQRNQKAHFNAV